MGKFSRQLLALQLSAISRLTEDPPDAAASTEQAESRKRGREDEAEPAQKAAPLNPSIQATLDHLSRFGKHFARSVDLFASWATIFRDGCKFEVDRMEDVEDTVYTEEEIENYEKFKILLASFNVVQTTRFLGDVLDPDKGQVFTEVAASVLNAQLGEAKTNDSATLKKRVIFWLGNPAGLDPESKNQRGFKTRATAALLLPMSQFPYTEEKRRILDEGEVKLNAADWPMFLYANHECSRIPRERRKGLFKGPILLMAAKAILTSPSSVNGSSKSRRQSNSSKHGMKEINGNVIAYISMLLYYALCEDATFHPQTHAGFNLKAFYHGIVGYFHDPDNKRHVDSTLKWWNKEVFSGAQGELGGGNGVPTFEDDEGVDYSDDEV